MAEAINSSKSLDNLKKGSVGFVSHFTSDKVASKLLTMGILPGTRLEFVRKAPFGGGYYIKADQNFLALRKQEAACIIVK